MASSIRVGFSDPQNFLNSASLRTRSRAISAPRLVIPCVGETSSKSSETAQLMMPLTRLWHLLAWMPLTSSAISLRKLMMSPRFSSFAALEPMRSLTWRLYNASSASHDFL